MTLQLPTSRQLMELAKQCGLSIDDSEIAYYKKMMGGVFENYRILDTIPDEVPAVRYPRTPGYRPSSEEDPHNCWYRKTDVKGQPTGPLSGKRVALKDNILLAGVPMMNGSSILDGFIPDFDATVVTRVLDAGGEISGKAHCENMSLSPASYTNSYGWIHNPHRRGYSAAGSSSGCGAVVAAGETDMAIGGDQGGSIRLPASVCGIYGMKPTFGLVPYTGIIPIEIMMDHAGPMTNSVADNALLLEVIAGDDGIDQRQRSPRVQKYTEALGVPVKGMRVGVVKEGFQIPGAEEVVNERVRSASEHLRKLGVTVEEVSVPLHLMGAQVCRVILNQGAARTLFWGDGFGGSRGDLYPLGLMERFRLWRERADDLSITAKLVVLTGTHAANVYGGFHYGKAMNVARRMRGEYDKLLQSYDLLLMPTTPTRATPLPEPGTDRETAIGRTKLLSMNTVPFNATQHPAMSVPCAMADGLPVGMMLVGRHYDESTIYRLAHAFEQSWDWKTL